MEMHLYQIYIDVFLCAYSSSGFGNYTRSEYTWEKPQYSDLHSAKDDDESFLQIDIKQNTFL